MAVEYMSNLDKWSVLSGAPVFDPRAGIKTVGKNSATLAYLPTVGETGDCKMSVLNLSNSDSGAYPAVFNEDGSGIAFIGLSTDQRSAAAMRQSRVLRVVALDPEGNETVLVEKATPNFGFSMALWSLERKDGMLVCRVGNDTKHVLTVPDMGGSPGVYLRNLANFFYAIIE
jgi:hypothetical protein